MATMTTTTTTTTTTTMVVRVLGGGMTIPLEEALISPFPSSPSSYFAPLSYAAFATSICPNLLLQELLLLLPPPPIPLPFRTLTQPNLLLFGK